MQLLTDIVLLITAIIGLIVVSRKLDVIHVLVNSQFTAALKKIEKLEKYIQTKEKD